ncbi:MULTISPECIES: NAD(P)H-dependent glycerol-3-phosphate dehydrogenase [Bacillus]|uniref:NAD(P)H-dependent glycerol-3-phosphate dehydrogenase n=1 Tax=Bacillus TaxID=1386 RepID=UPI001F05F2AB|nr:MULTISPECIES: NAD(P)H-dependent glycerol-3-phosphate dehydrogenase [Bacillus]MED1412195.1 NAD(P)H-dependent glycerol-3-phosphate dehydrogenase [Bacillus paramycoides]MED1466637.1 NAD(P)H-dependent glycerol-3-phosphate dehydrogenase [Bacillus paramycoides]MED1491786.1 NAD(P)H-dependent glycerol-3-phosphate dehydrogenase [Bacillus paramycoides]
MRLLNISVLGCGRWGTFIAWYANKIDHNVMLWGRENSRNYIELNETRKNDYLKLSEDIELSNSLHKAISFAEIIIIAISAQELRSFANQLNLINEIQGKTFILCMKGLEATSGKRLSRVFGEIVGKNTNIAVWVGPGHVQDFVNDIPNCMVIGSENIGITKKIVQEFNSDLIRFYYGQDLIGNEIGAATKNVMGIAAGMLDGLNYSSLKGSLMARGTRELSRLVTAMGGNDLTIYGLSHLGDYEATLFSLHSHNRKFGEAFVLGQKFEKLAEGVSTVKALKELSKQYDVELPISNALYEILFESKDAKDTLEELFLRPVKFEF